MGLLQQMIKSRRSRRRLKKSVKAVAASSDSVPLSAQPLFDCHVIHEVSRSKDDAKHFRWIDKSRAEEGSLSDCGAGQEDDTSSLNSPRLAACSGWTAWIWMYSCLDWGYPTHQLGSKKNKVGDQKRLVDCISDDATQASTPYDETGGSSQPSESRVDQILKVPAALVDDVSDITSIPSSDGESESESDSDSDSYSSSSEEVDFSTKEVMCKKKVDKYVMGYLIG